jgi:hypothetical protein
MDNFSKSCVHALSRLFLQMILSVMFLTMFETVVPPRCGMNEDISLPHPCRTRQAAAASGSAEFVQIRWSTVAELRRAGPDRFELDLPRALAALGLGRWPQEDRVLISSDTAVYNAEVKGSLCDRLFSGTFLDWTGNAQCLLTAQVPALDS